MTWDGWSSSGSWKIENLTCDGSLIDHGGLDVRHVLRSWLIKLIEEIWDQIEKILVDPGSRLLVFQIEQKVHKVTRDKIR